MFRRNFIYVLGALFLTAGGLLAQQPPVEARIAGLENNEEYMSLLREDARLQEREDSIVNAVAVLRERLREDPVQRQRYSQEILQLESRIFEIRNAKGRLIDRINSIEQEWVLANLDGAVSGSGAVRNTPVSGIPDSLKVRNLVDNLYFREHLAETDYAALCEAQRLETRAAEYVNRYFANHATLTELAETYGTVQNEAEAMDIFGRLTALQGVNRMLGDSLAEVWNYIFDNKNYAYGYILDELGREEILSREEEELARAARQLTELRGATASDAVADYFLRKRVMVDYEGAVAGELALDAARDSLRGVAEQIGAVDFRLPRIDVAERYFLDYDSVAFSSKPKYTYQNPIPECKVYANGTIYRILLGTFNTKRAAATFRGAYPLFYLIDEAGKWNYYTGGFATLEEAETAQKLLKEHGFVRPEVVVWTDGVMRNLSRDPVAQDLAYRVEITGTDALSDAVKQVIAETASGHELSRVGQQIFVVGGFTDRAVADRLADAVRLADPALEIKVVEISQP